MKNWLIRIIPVFFLFLSAKGQVVPNGNLANWHNVASQYDQPDHWTTTDTATILAGVVGVTKDADAADDNFAARMETKSVPLFGAVPGAIGTGTLDIFTQTFSGGFPLNGNNPQALIGYYKYTPVNNDSCLAYAALFKWNTSTLKRDTLAVAFFIGGAQSSYALFSAPFFTLISGTPDSAVIIIISSKDLASAQVGSVLFADDIELSDAVGVNEVSQQNLSLYPNPTDDLLQLNLPAELNARSVIITNVAGTSVKQFHVSSGAIKISTKSFAPGTYVCFVKNDEGKVVTSGKFSVQH